MEDFYQHRSVFDENHVMSRLPPYFQKKLSYNMYNWIIMQVPLFAGLHQEVQSMQRSKQSAPFSMFRGIARKPAVAF